MKAWLSVYALLACIACDEGGEEPVTIICVDCATADMAGVGGAGGEGGAGGGAGGGVGEGGAGGSDEGGAGGEGGSGEGGSGEGGSGEGGGCVPGCDAQVCGPDGCGGVCGPGCADGESCSAGACIRGECPAGTFECGGNCVDLLTDADHCGSCGNGCVDAWPAASPLDGLSFEDARIGARCVDAACVYQCEGSETQAEELVSDVDHCGACGAACDTDVSNKIGDACIDAQCACLLPTEDGPIAGAICDGTCEYTLWDNCNGGCCPRLMQGNNRVAGDVLSAFVFDMPSTDTARIFTDFPRGGTDTYLFSYADGTPPVEIWFATSEPRTIPILPAGRYLLIVLSSSEPGVVSFQRSRTAVDFTAPGTQVREASAKTVHVNFRVPEDGEYDVVFDAGPDSNRCTGAGQIVLFDSAAQTVAEMARMEDCNRRLAARWRGRLSAGLYTVRAFGGELRGDWEVRVE